MQIGELDFGDLNAQVEVISSILTASQEFMRQQQVGCNSVFKMTICFFSGMHYSLYHLHIW